MTDKVFMSPKNGALVVGTPLYMRHPEQIGSDQIEVVVAIVSDKPAAYMIDYGGDKLQLLSAEWVEKYLECLGDL